MNPEFEQARRHFSDGIAHFEARRLEQAEACFAAAQALVPGRPSVLTNLGAARARLGRHADAVVPLRQAATAEPGNFEAWSYVALSLAVLGRPQEALAATARALALDGSRADLWTHQGTLLREQGELEGAARSFERALALGGDARTNGYFLASVRGGGAPPQPPREYVEGLFDDYAADFQQHLVGALRYRAPQTLLQRLPPRARGGWGTVLDLGCGTGLCGPLLRPGAARLQGVDLSARMVEQARAGGSYDDLAHADVLAHLRACPAGGHGLVVACDVFIYVGALDAVFAEVARVLAPGGWFALTIEPAEGPDVTLFPSLRYGHAPASIVRLAAAHGLRVAAQFAAPLREDQGVPIEGVYFHLERP